MIAATTRRLEPLPLAGAEQKALREVWGQTLVELAADYPDLVVLDGDLANSTRADIFAAAVPDRFFEMGIAEQNMVGVAAGMATLGFVPWLSTFAAFMANRATDQVRIVVAQPHLNVKMCGGYTGILTGKTGKTHQSVEDIAIFRAMPGVVTIAPADAVELRSAMRAMMETDRADVPARHPRPIAGDLPRRLPLRRSGPPCSCATARKWGSSQPAYRPCARWKRPTFWPARGSPPAYSTCRR